MPEAIAAISAAAIQKRGALIRDTLTRDDMALASSFDLVMNDLIGLLRVGTEYHEDVHKLASLAGQKDHVRPDTAEEWRGYARDMGREAEVLRQMLTSFRQVMIPLKEARDPKSLIILRLFDIWNEQVEDLADQIEDLAETMALAVHEPFCNAVRNRLGNAGVA